MRKVLLFFTLAISQLAFSKEFLLVSSTQENPDYINYLSDKNSSLGFIPSPIQPSFNGLLQLRSDVSLPSKFDLRDEQGYNSQPRLLPPRSQENTSTCWGFATMDCLQSIWSKNFETEYYSVENMVNCHDFTLNKNDGGSRDMATAYLTRFAGPVSETKDPFVNSTTGSCNTISNTDKIALVSQVLYLPRENKELIKQMIFEYGGVFTGVASSFSSSSFYNTTTNASYIPSSDQTTTAGHAGTIVGWDDDFDRTNFSLENQPQNNGAWIVKNTYGTSKNDNGYYYLSYEDKFVGTDATVFSGRIEKNEFDNIYYYDKLGAVDYLGNNNVTYAEALIKHTALSPQIITGIGTYAQSASTIIDIEIYTFKYENDLYGLIGSSIGNNCYLPGYYTFTFDEPVAINGDFYVKIKYHTTNYFPLPIEKMKDNANPEIMPKNYQWARFSEDDPWTNCRVQKKPETPEDYYDFDLCAKVLTQDYNTNLCAPNDNIENARMLTIGITEGPFNNICATAQENEPYPADAGCTSQMGWCEQENKIENSLWFTFIAPASGKVKIVTSGFDNQIAVYDATDSGYYADIISGDPNKYRILAANDDASDDEAAASINLLENLTPGKTYWLQMDGSFGGAYGSATIVITEENPTNKKDTLKSPIKINNPVRDDVLRIQSSSPIFEVTIWNLVGNIYKSIHLNGETQIDLSTNDLSCGYYLIQIKTEDRSLLRKIIIAE
jgi:C1A family cysteine protease